MPISYAATPQHFSLKWSASHMLNNLTLCRASGSNRLLTLGISHKVGFAMVTASEDGVKQIRAEVISRSLTEDHKPTAETDPRYSSHIIQAAFIVLPIRTVLVLACTKSVQIFEPDGTKLLFIHMIDNIPRNNTDKSMYSRGIAKIGENNICVGNHQGEILVFNIPAHGTNIILKETMPGHQSGITGLASNENVLVSSDTHGKILIWEIKTLLQRNVIEPIDSSGITSLAMWGKCIIAAYANGMIRFFDSGNAQICGSIAAHARSINAIDCNASGLVASAGDDCFIRIWKISGDPQELEISHECNHRIENKQLVGVKFLNLNGPDIAVSTYDSNDVIVLRS